MKSNWGTVLAVLLSAGVNVSYAQLKTEELEAADAGQLKAVPAESLPAFGSFYSWQRSWQPPLPYDPFPELTVYDLGGSRFLMDDWALDYALISELAALMAESEGGGQAQMAGMSGGCGLWLDISATSSNAVMLGLHNTRTGQTYTIWSIEDLNDLPNWTSETNVTPVAISHRCSSPWGNGRICFFEPLKSVIM